MLLGVRNARRKRDRTVDSRHVARSAEGPAEDPSGRGEKRNQRGREVIRILFAALLFVAGCGESNLGNTGENLLDSTLEQHGLPRGSIPELPPCGTWKQYLFGDPTTYHHIETLCREGELISAVRSTVFCGTRNSIESATPAAPYADICA